MGLGIIGAKRLMDDFRDRIEGRAGTTVTLFKKAAGERAPAYAAAAEQADGGDRRSGPGNILDDLRQQNRELLRAMDELRARQEDLRG